MNSENHKPETQGSIDCHYALPQSDVSHLPTLEATEERRVKLIELLKLHLADPVVEAQSSSSYTLEMVDNRLAKLEGELAKTNPPLEPCDHQRFSEELAYLQRLRKRDFSC